MSTVKTMITFSRIFPALVALSFASGCFESRIGSDATPLIFERSQLSYHGATPRNLGLQFNLQGNSDRTIKAVVTLPEYLDFKNQKLQFRWQLDEGVEVIGGERNGAITITTSEKKIEILIRVNNFSVQSKKFIRFEASSLIGKNRFFIDGMVSSQSESSFENFVQGIENYKKKVNWNNEK